MGPFRSSATRRLAALALALGALGACGSDTSSDAGSASAGTTAVADPAAAADTSPLAFQNAAVGGGTIDFEALAGRPTALWFWAPY